MAKFNYGSEYLALLKTNKLYYNNGYYIPNFVPNNYDFNILNYIFSPHHYYYYGLNDSSYAFYNNFFGKNEGSSLFIGKDELGSKVYGLFKLPKKTDSDGVYRVSVSLIEPILSNNYNQTGLKLVNRSAEVQILKWGGSSYNNNQTSSILDPCAGASTDSATQMTVCAGNEKSINIGPTFNHYSGKTNSYKVVFKGIVKGLDICYDRGYNVKPDLSGCVHYYAWYNPTASTVQCESGTWVNGRCETTFEEACYGGSGQEPGESYDPSTQTCVLGEDVVYVGDINFTPVTLTGVGRLPASVGLSASKLSENNLKSKYSLKKLIKF